MALVALATPALASGGGEAPTVLGMPQWVALSINLVVFFGAIGYFAGPALIKFLGGKQLDVEHALERASRQRADAEQMESRLTAKIDELRQEVDELADRSEREGERERREILAEAEREVARVQQQTKNEIEHHLQQARQDLTRHAAQLAGKLAGDRLAASVTGADRRRLFDDNLLRLEKR